MKLKNSNRSIKIAKQKGVALLMTLLIVIIATLLSTEIWFNNTLDVSRQYNNRASYQANHYAKGMVLWAFDVLRQDYEESAAFDNHSEAWNQTIAGIQVEDGLLSGQLTDLDGKFNLNNLVISGVEQPQNIAYFKRVLGNLEMDQSLVDKIMDFMDVDQIPRTQGAEDPVYLSKNPSYRTSGQNFIHISELKLVAGIDDFIYERLTSFVTALPIIGDVPTKININTTNTLLLLSLDDRIKPQEALALYKEGNAAHLTLADFYRQPAILYYDLGNQALGLNQLIQTHSIWYQAKINVKMENVLFQKFALLRRSTTSTSVNQWSETKFD